MTQIILAPRRPKGDGTEPVLPWAVFKYRLALSTIDGTGQAVKSVWSDAITITGTPKTIDLDPGTYEGLLTAPDGLGKQDGFVERSFRIVPVSGSPILWENLVQTSAPTVPSFATITQANLDALRADLNARMDAIEAGGVGGGAPAGTGVGGRYKPEDLEGVGSTGVSLAKTGNPATARAAIDAPATVHTHPISQIVASGTRDGTTFLSGDGTFKSVSGVVAGSVTWDNVAGKPSEVTGLAAKLTALDATDASLDTRLDLLELAGGTPSAPSGTQTLTWNGTTYGTYDTSKLRHDFVGGPDPLTLSNYASLLTAFDTWTEPDAPDPTTGDPNRVVVGLTSFPLASTNGPRGNNELVAYTYSANQTASPANQYGVEVVVDAATKKPKAVYNRFTNTKYTDTAQSSFTGQTPIASGEFVLSGHGNIDQPGYAGTWLWETLTKDVSGARRVDTSKVVQLVIDTTTPTNPTNPNNPGTTGTWLSGVSSNTVVGDGSFAAWRGRPVEIAGNWGPSSGPMSEFVKASDYEIQQTNPAANYRNIQAVDYACGAWTTGNGSWAAAASGALDPYWRDMILRCKANWGTRSASKFFMRFAHEFNLNGYPWTVPADQITNFITAFRRFADLLRANFPGAQMVWCPNAGSSYSYDIRTLYPGDDWVDVIGLDTYNNYPWVNDQAAFNTKMNSTANGGPLGPETYRLFALSKGKPLALCEWGNDGNPAGPGNEGGGEAPVWMALWYAWIKANAGTGAGNIIYEVLFNSPGFPNSLYTLFPIDAESGNTTTAAKYAELWTTSVPSTDPGTGTPTPVPAGSLPARVNSVWHHRWSGPSLRNYPESTKQALDLVVLGLAQSGGAGTGNLSYQPNNGQSVADHAADCKAFVARGINVIMGFGGSSDGGITITNTAQADQAFNSFASFRSTYGITGIDIDLEPSGSSWSAAALVYLVQRLKTAYGSGFICGVTPGLYGTHTARWMDLAQKLGNNMDYMAPMLYDFPEANDSRLSGVAVNKCDIMAAAGIPATKMMLGFAIRPETISFSEYPNSTPNPTVMVNAINAVKAKYPALRGAFLWEDWWQSRRSNPWDGTLAIRSTLPRS